MGSSGEDARIQALFRELVIEDQSLAPSFAGSWRRAETQHLMRGETRSRRLSSASWQPMALFAMAVIVTTLAAVFGARQQRESGFILPLVSKIELPSFSLEPVSPARTIKPVRVNHPSRRKRLPQPELAKTATRMEETVALSFWQSPTAQLMQSPTSPFRTIAPLLDQSARELQLFLPEDKKPLEESPQEILLQQELPQGKVSQEKRRS